MFNIGSAELILILLVAFVVVGPKDLPKVARALARVVKYLKALFEEFKEEAGLDETMNELKAAQNDLTQTMREADPTRELRTVKTETEKAVRETKKAIKEPSGTSTK
jgi:twin arginine-targeting protein translocase TatB